MQTRLLIDIGNTRLKWALVQQNQWLKQGCLNHQDLAEQWLATLVELCQPLAQLPTLWISNVAGPTMTEQLEQTCPATFWHKHYIQAQAKQCGIANDYDTPTQLGCDRWSALIAAWHFVGKACLVVNCGTATTIDALSSNGHFLGGLILPGLNLMQDSLQDRTHIQHHGNGHYQTFPRNTPNALFNGVLQAQVGAILQQHKQLRITDAPIVLSGGAAPIIRDFMQQSLDKADKPDIKMIDNLVLHGLNLISQEQTDD